MKILFIFLLLLSGPLLATEHVEVGRFAAGDVEGWQQKTFEGKTQYRLLTQDGETAMMADSVASASAFYREMKIDLDKTPVLHWRWRKLLAVKPQDENARAGDDFVARVYVIKDGGLWVWNTRAINYVWSFRHRKGEVWDNPFAGKRAKMVSIRDAQDAAQVWFEQRRNVREDFNKLLGQDIKRIDGIAIMTDSDNTGTAAQAEYGDIWFSAE
jgi:hypothetical protein